MGFASLGILDSVVRATIGLRWKEDGEMSDILALVDADISQAIQVSYLAMNLLVFGLTMYETRVPRRKSMLVVLAILRLHVR